MLPPRPDTQNLETRKISADAATVRWEMWHPQWGGYAFPCVVEFGPPDEYEDDHACFQVYEWSNGEFPRVSLENVRHYCNPVQLLEFAANIIQAQSEAGYTFAANAPRLVAVQDKLARIAAILSED